MVWFKVLHEITDYDLIKINQLLKLNHQMVFSHIIMVNRRNQEIKKEFNKRK